MRRLINNTIALFLLVGLFACSVPKAMFDINEPEGNRAPAKFKFENKSEKADSYTWDFGDGTTSEEANPEHNYSLSGKYDVTLYAKKGKKVNTVKKSVFIEAPKQCLVELETDLGTIVIKLFDDTPLHRDNFIKLVEESYYDDLIFHRVINSFMIQGGDPNSRNAKPDARLGSGGPSYTIPAEINDAHVHVKGALCAARKGDQVNPKKNSSGSQFYIVHGKKTSAASLGNLSGKNGIDYTAEQIKAYEENGGTPFLDGNYTVFGQVVEGMDVIDQIAAVKTKPGDRPVKDIKMKLRIVR